MKPTTATLRTPCSGVASALKRKVVRERNQHVASGRHSFICVVMGLHGSNQRRFVVGVPHGPLRVWDVQNATSVMLGTPAPDVVFSFFSASVTRS